MPEATTDAMNTGVREAVGLFDDLSAMETCIDELQSHGFDRSDLTLLAPAEEIATPIHHISETEDSPTVPRSSYIEKESLGGAEGALIALPLYIGALSGAGAIIATGGSVGSAVVAALIAGAVGGGVGGIFAARLARRRGNYYRRQIELGGMPLWVHTRDREHERTAVKTLRKYAARDVHLHDLPRTEDVHWSGRTTNFRILNRSGRVSLH